MAGAELKTRFETRGTSASTASRATATGCAQSDISKIVSGWTPPSALAPSGPENLRVVTLTEPSRVPSADLPMKVSCPVDFP